jgi:hypothetical protein
VLLLLGRLSISSKKFDPITKLVSNNSCQEFKKLLLALTVALENSVRARTRVMQTLILEPFLCPKQSSLNFNQVHQPKLDS